MEGQAGGPVSGRIITRDGKPVAGATVSWISRTEEGTALLASVPSDGEGQFRFEGTERLRHKDDYPQLLVETAGWGLAFREVSRGGEPVEISLLPPTKLRVAFMDQEGRPVADLEVFPLGLRSKNGSYLRFPANAAARFSRRTDARGVAVFPAIPQGGQVQLDTTDERFAHLDADPLPLSHGPVTRRPTIRLQPGASVQGRITIGPSGKPAAGIKIGARGICGSEVWGEAVSDSSGDYHLTRLCPGAYNVAADLKAGMARDWTARAHEAVVVRAGEHRQGIDFALIHGAVITGRAIAEDNGQPILGVHIGVYGPARPRSGARVQGTITGPDGAYQLRVPGGKQHLYLAMAAPPPGFLMPSNAAQDLTLQDGETVTIDFKLPRGARPEPVRGQVVGPEGQPEPNAEVALMTSHRGLDQTTLQTDASGAFVIDEQMLMQTITLRARQGDRATPAGLVVTGGEAVTLRLQEHALAALSGRVTGTAGQPIAGAPITPMMSTPYSNSGAVAAVTDKEGRYFLPSLWPDLCYAVMATARGFGQQISERVELRPGESRELPPLVLKTADRAVAGRVVDEKGDPVAGAQVSLRGPESTVQRKATDGEGRFLFDGVVDETITLQAHFPGYRSARKSAPAGSADLIVVLASESAAKNPDTITRLQEPFDSLRGQSAPPLHAVAWVNSPPLSMEQLRGRVVLIDFWGIGCGPCVASLPGVQWAAEQFASKGLVVIGLHAAGASPAELEAFAREHHLTYPLAIDAPDDQHSAFGKTFRQYAVKGIPAVAVIDRNGRVAYLGHFLSEAIGSLGPLLASSTGGEGAG